MIDPGRSGAQPAAARRAPASRASSASTKRSTTPHRGRDADAAAGAGDAGVIVRAYFAHHQGMTLVALANALLDDRMVERFHADPRVQATELLLQERVPRDAAPIEPRPDDEMRVAGAGLAGAASRRFRTPHTVVPHTQFLSNGRYIAVGHQRRRRRQHLARPGGHPVAARSRRPTPAASSSTCATCAAARSGRRPISPTRREPGRLRASPSSSTRRPSGGATTTSRRSSRSPCRPRTTSRCGG